jgi:hypothetical protein
MNVMRQYMSLQARDRLRAWKYTGTVEIGDSLYMQPGATVSTNKNQWHLGWAYQINSDTVIVDSDRPLVERKSKPKPAKPKPRPLKLDIPPPREPMFTEPVFDTIDDVMKSSEELHDGKVWQRLKDGIG